jgi:hypothetical protein
VKIRFKNEQFFILVENLDANDSNRQIIREKGEEILKIYLRHQLMSLKEDTVNNKTKVGRKRRNKEDQNPTISKKRACICSNCGIPGHGKNKCSFLFKK